MRRETVGFSLNVHMRARKGERMEKGRDRRENGGGKEDRRIRLGSEEGKRRKCERERER